VAGDLPAALRQAIERRLEGVSRSDLGRASARLSEHYRGGSGSATAIAGRADILSYLVSRMPATYAASAAVLAEVRRRAPGFAPETLLDVGAGPASASWAAVATWPGIGSVAMIDRHSAFLEMAGDLAADSGLPALRQSRRILADMTGLADQDVHADLVVASYALAEVPADIGAVVGSLWRMSRGLLVLVEPGTPAGFVRIREARDLLIAAGAAIVAPCPHANACPIVAPDWCHFAERLSRSRDHRLAKSASLNFEDEKFSYVAVARPEVVLDRPEARVLSPPRINKAEIRLKLCTPSGLSEEAVPRRDKEAYARARRFGWGSAVPGP
jgi:ribosomal protein RSM22 (predicted rRNA methylase)